MRHEPLVNPCCGYLVTMDTDVDNLIDPSIPAVKPRPGDLNVCLNCGAILVYNLDLSHRRAIPTDLEDLKPEDMDNMVKAIAYIKERGPIPKKD